MRESCGISGLSAKPHDSGPVEMPAKEFAARYGASTEDMDLVVQFARDHGLTVQEVHLGRRSVVVSGTVARMEAAFAVTLNLYQPPKPPRNRATGQAAAPNTYRGRDGFIHVPPDLAGIVVGVFGLDCPRIGRRNDTGADPPNTVPLTVPTVVKLYNFPTNSASGQTIGIISNAGYQQSDIDLYYSNPALGGYKGPTILDVAAPARNTYQADLETTQDICIASTVAQGADIAVYFTDNDPQSWLALVQRVVHPDAGDPKCTVLCSSFAVFHGDAAAMYQSQQLTKDWIEQMSAAFQDAAIQKVMVCVASGDCGSDRVTAQPASSIQPATRGCFPAAARRLEILMGPLSMNMYGMTRTHLKASNLLEQRVAGSALPFRSPAIRSVQVFHRHSMTIVSDGESPDVAGNASPNSGYGITVNEAPALEPEPVLRPTLRRFGRRSYAALRWNVGFLNQRLYALGSQVVRGIKSPPGPANNGINGSKGYPAGAGWNGCTGLGVVNGMALLTALTKQGRNFPP